MPPIALPDPPLTDGVVTLREHRPADRDAVVAALQDPEIPRWTTLPSPYGPDEYDAYLARAAELRACGRALPLLIVDAGDRVLGGATLHEMHTERPDIGYWIAPEHRGRGYAARAVRLLRAHAVELGFRRVDLLIHPDNAASQHVARSAGFAATDGLVRCARHDDGTAEHVRFTWAAR